MELSWDFLKGAHNFRIWKRPICSNLYSFQALVNGTKYPYLFLGLLLSRGYLFDKLPVVKFESAFHDEKVNVLTTQPIPENPTLIYLWIHQTQNENKFKIPVVEDRMNMMIILNNIKKPFSGLKIREQVTFWIIMKSTHLLWIKLLKSCF